MRANPSGLSTGLRGLLVACISVLGLVAIVGSGGGFPPCTAPYCNTEPLPPPPTATIQPPYITLLVGSPVTYTVLTAGFSGALSYQWSRSSDGGATYADIPGATGTSYALASVNLGDDGAVFRVRVSGSGFVSAQARSHLAVSATPGIVFEDGEFQPADWTASPVVDPGVPPPLTSDDRIATGGNPDAYRRMVYQVPQGTGSARVFYTSRAATYDPQAQGAIYVIDYAEDCIALQSSELTYTESNLLIEQAGRRYLSNTFDSCVLQNWSGVANRASLKASDFRLFGGPACAVGESCPDFSATALPMRLGYWRIALGMPGSSIAHGIDNWKVTVWRR